jgi:hypothetical protein
VAAPEVPTARAQGTSYFSKIIGNYRRMPPDMQRTGLGCLGCFGVVVIIAIVAGGVSLWSFATSGPGADSYGSIEEMKADFDRVYSEGISGFGGSLAYVGVKGNAASVYIWNAKIGIRTYKLTEDRLSTALQGFAVTDLHIGFDGKKVEVRYAFQVVSDAWMKSSETYILKDKDLR